MEYVLRGQGQFFQTRSLDANFVHHVGAAAEYISKLAARGKFDLVIMGTHGHHFIPGIVLGSVAMKVLSLCSTPVILVR
jgi:nucleotide-binding universal stress UspA family protein